MGRPEDAIHIFLNSELVAAWIEGMLISRLMN